MKHPIEQLAIILKGMPKPISVILPNGKWYWFEGKVKAAKYGKKLFEIKFYYRFEDNSAYADDVLVTDNVAGHFFKSPPYPTLEYRKKRKKSRPTMK